MKRPVIEFIQEMNGMGFTTKHIEGISVIVLRGAEVLTAREVIREGGCDYVEED